MNSLVKFSGPRLDSRAEFKHPNVWQREEHLGSSRLLVGALMGEIPLILELCRHLDGPFGILYILLASRLGRVAGRYQNPDPIAFDELELFLYTFQEFFEQDGRHHLWVASASGEGQFVFDNHNVVYAYGDLDCYESYLESAGFTSGSVAIPVPHTHHHHAEFDSAEDELMGYWKWKMFPLQPGDDV